MVDIPAQAPSVPQQAETVHPPAPPTTPARLGFEPLCGEKPNAELVGTLTFGRCDKPPKKSNIVDTGVTETNVSRKQAIVSQGAGSVVVEGGGVNTVAVVRANGEDVLFLKKGDEAVAMFVGDILEGVFCVVLRACAWLKTAACAALATVAVD